MSENQAIMPVAQAEILPATIDMSNVGLAEVMFNEKRFNQVQRVAAMFIQSGLVPKSIRGESREEGIANIVLAFSLALEMKENPLIVMQNIYFVGGRAGWSTQYMIAKANRAKVFRSRIKWRTRRLEEITVTKRKKTGWDRDARENIYTEEKRKVRNIEVTAYATLADDDEPVEVTLDMVAADAEHWTDSEKYYSMPEQMLCWRTAAMLIRRYAPEVMLGYQTVEEIEVIPTVDITPPPAPEPPKGDPKTIEELKAKLEAKLARPSDASPAPAPDPVPNRKPQQAAMTPPPEVVDAVFVEKEEQKPEPPKPTPAPPPAPTKPKSDPAPAAKPNSPVDTGFDPKTDVQAKIQADAIARELSAVFADARALKVEEQKVVMWETHIRDLHAKGDARFEVEFARFKEQVAKKRQEASSAALKPNSNGVTQEQLAAAYSQAYDLALAQGDNASIEAAARYRNAGDAVELANLLAMLKAKAQATPKVPASTPAVQIQEAFEALSKLAEGSKNRDAWIIQGRKAMQAQNLADLQRLTSDLQEVISRSTEPAKPVQAPAAPAPEPKSEKQDSLPRALQLIQTGIEEGVLVAHLAQQLRAAFQACKSPEERQEQETKIESTLADLEAGALLDAMRASGIKDPQPKREWMKTMPKLHESGWYRALDVLLASGDLLKSGKGAGSKYQLAAAPVDAEPVLVVQAVLDVSDEELDHAYQSAISMVERALEQNILTEGQAAEGSDSVQTAFEQRDVAKLKSLTDAIDRRATSMGVLL